MTHHVEPCAGCLELRTRLDAALRCPSMDVIRRVLDVVIDEAGIAETRGWTHEVSQRVRDRLLREAQPR